MKILKDDLPAIANHAMQNKSENVRNRVENTTRQMTEQKEERVN